MRSSPEIQIVWFKRDLRTADHRALAQASRAGPVMPLFVIEPELWLQSDMSGRHWAFVRECIAELREDLAALGQPLIVRTGNVIDLFERARRRYGNIKLWSHEETGNGWTYGRDKQVSLWARANNIVWTELRQSGVIRKLKTRNGWAKSWDAFMAEPETMPPSALPALDNIEPGGIPTTRELALVHDLCPDRQTGGRRAALSCLQSFLHLRGAPYRRAMSSPAAGAKHCSRLSPHLAWGTISMREAAQATWMRQRQLKADGIKDGWRGAMSSFQGRLHWRDHFTQKLEDEPELEFCNLHPAYNDLRPSEPDTMRLAAWSKGQTGLPFVDACMRALIHTGWMNFRMRAMLMAVASYHLWLDWRAPGEHLARMFTDYEPGIHWPQVQMQSGTTGINTVRIYNPIKQGYDQDPTGTFVRKWIPELVDVPAEHLQEPWRWERAGSVLDKKYPMPIIDHLVAAKEARQKVWAIRKNGPFRDGAAAIQLKHGSRKSGVAMIGRKIEKSKDRNQLSLNFDSSEKTSI